MWPSSILPWWEGDVVSLHSRVLCIRCGRGLYCRGGRVRWCLSIVEFYVLDVAVVYTAVVGGWRGVSP